jgi:intein-encoded DNA endonuclease-like protein
LRERSGGFRPLKERIRLYGEVKRLWSAGLSYQKIGDQLGISDSLARIYALRDGPPTVERYHPDLTPSPELAYLLGFWLGDGKASGHEKKVQFKLADKEQLELVNRIVARLLDREAKLIHMEDSFYAVGYDSSILYDFLDKPVTEHEAMIQEFGGDFLRGFFDAEGYVSVGLSRTRKVFFSIAVVNTNEEYLNLAERLLLSLDVGTNRHVTNRKGGVMIIRGRSFVRKKDVWHLTISGLASIRRFAEVAGFWNDRKASKLSDCITLISLAPEERIRWFLAHYVKIGRHWVPIGKQRII